MEGLSAALPPPPGLHQAAASASASALPVRHGATAALQGFPDALVAFGAESELALSIHEVRRGVSARKARTPPRHATVCAGTSAITSCHPWSDQACAVPLLLRAAIGEVRAAAQWSPNAANLPLDAAPAMTCAIEAVRLLCDRVAALCSRCHEATSSPSSAAMLVAALHSILAALEACAEQPLPPPPARAQWQGWMVPVAETGAAAACRAASGGRAWHLIGPMPRECCAAASLVDRDGCGESRRSCRAEGTSNAILVAATLLPATRRLVWNEGPLPPPILLALACAGVALTADAEDEGAQHRAGGCVPCDASASAIARLCLDIVREALEQQASVDATLTQGLVELAVAAARAAESAPEVEMVSNEAGHGGSSSPLSHAAGEAALLVAGISEPVCFALPESCARLAAAALVARVRPATGAISSTCFAEDGSRSDKAEPQLGWHAVDTRLSEQHDRYYEQLCQLGRWPAAAASLVSPGGIVDSLALWCARAAASDAECEPLHAPPPLGAALSSPLLRSLSALASVLCWPHGVGFALALAPRLAVGGEAAGPSRGESMATQRGWLEVTAAAALPAGAKYAGSGEPRATALLLLTLLCADAQAGLLLRRRLGLVAALRAPMGLAARHADVEGAEPSLPASSSADNGSPLGARFLNIFHGWHDGDRGDNGVSSPSGQYGAADGAPPAAFADLSSPPCCLDEVCRSRLLARLLQWGVPSEWALDHRSLARSEYFPLHRPPAPAANRPPPLSSAVTTAYPPRSPLLAPVAAAAALLEGGSLDAATAALRAAFAAAGVHANTTGTDSLCANSAESLPQRRAVGQPIRLSPPSEPVPSIAVAANRLPPHWVTGAVLLLRYAARAGSLSTEAAAREGDGLPSGAHLASLSLVSLPPPAHRLSYAGESLTVACARLLAFLADLSSIVWDSSGSGSSEDTPLDLFAAMAWTLGGDTAARRSLGARQSTPIPRRSARVTGCRSSHPCRRPVRMPRCPAGVACRFRHPAGSALARPASALRSGAGDCPRRPDPAGRASSGDGHGPCNGQSRPLPTRSLVRPPRRWSLPCIRRVWIRRCSLVVGSARAG